MAKQKRNGAHYRNLFFLFLSLIAAVFILKDETFHSYILHLGKLEYIGAFCAGFFFVSTFTTIPATIVLFILAEALPVWAVAGIAGIGAMIGDFSIFQFFKNQDLSAEMYTIYKQLGGKKLSHVLHLRQFHWLLPVVGAIFFFTPLPDEIGVALMGISKLKSWKFLVFSLILDSSGIFILLSLTRIFRP